SVPLKAEVIQAVYDYIYTAWFTVNEGWKSTRRIRQQWWYYGLVPTVGWSTYTPFYWLGHYAPGPEDDAKYETLLNALTLAGARLTSQKYKGITIFPARLGGGEGNRPYTVWPNSQINHTQLKRA